MPRKFLVVALVAASSFVCFSSESEAGHLRRGKLLGHRNRGAVQAPACNTGCGSYAAVPVVADCGCAGVSAVGYDQGQHAVYGGTSNYMASPSTSGCGCGGTSQVGYVNGQQPMYGYN